MAPMFLFVVLLPNIIFSINCAFHLAWALLDRAGIALCICQISCSSRVLINLVRAERATAFVRSRFEAAKCGQECELRVLWCNTRWWWFPFLLAGGSEMMFRANAGFVTSLGADGPSLTAYRAFSDRAPRSNRPGIKVGNCIAG